MEKNKELTTMMELLEDLKETKITGVEALNDINDLRVRKCCKEVLNKTLDCIIDRIETELLPKEKQGYEEFHQQGAIFAYPRKEATRNDRLEHFETYYNTKYNNQIK